MSSDFVIVEGSIQSRLWIRLVMYSLYHLGRNVSVLRSCPVGRTFCEGLHRT